MKLSEQVDIIAYQEKRPDDAELKAVITPLVISARAILMRQEFTKTGRFPQSSILSTCLSTILVNSTECCDIDLGCKISRSELKIPQPILIKDEINFLFIGGLDLVNAYAFGYLKPDEVRHIKSRKFSSNKIFYTYINDYLYFFNDNALEKFKIRYVPSNPLEFLEIKDCCTGECCFDIEDQVFIEDIWEDAITKIVRAKLRGTQDPQILINKEKEI